MQLLSRKGINDYFANRFFSEAISCMKITFDDRLLIVGSEDGTLIIWIIVNTDGL